ncbi:MAG TPA: DUF6221 family protein [Jiangellaceae bacterium]
MTEVKIKELERFLRARLAEAMATADEFHRRGCGSLVDEAEPCTCGVPERIRRDVKAKRVVLGAVREDVNSWQEHEHVSPLGFWLGLRYMLLMRITELQFASPWSDHPEHWENRDPEPSEDDVEGGEGDE